MIFILLSVILIVILLLNIKATLYIIRDDLSEPKQRVFQILFVWLVPFIGALFVIVFYSPPDKPTGKYREIPEVGDDFALSGNKSNNQHTDVAGD